MSKFEEFKEFCKDKEFLINKVKTGQTTWQQLFEVYDIYGPDSEEFKEPEEKSQEEDQTDKVESEADNKKTEKKDGLNGFFDLLNGFDPDKISEGLSGVKKILAVLSEVTKPEDNEYVTKRKMTRPYQRSDD